MLSLYAKIIIIFFDLRKNLKLSCLQDQWKKNEQGFGEGVVEIHWEWDSAVWFPALCKLRRRGRSP